MQSFLIKRILQIPGRKRYRFLKRRYQPMMPAQLQSHPNVCGFNTIYAAFRLSNLC